jgi:hypothetical protein
MPRDCEQRFIVKMERPDGARMRVRLSSEETLIRLSESFLGKRE